MTILSTSDTRPGPGFDLSPLLELVGDDVEFLAELLTLFDLDSARLVAEVRRTVGPGGAALERSAHTLKGLLSHFGESTALELCRRLEARGAGRESTEANALAEAEALAAEVAAIRQILGRLAC
jgi:HPt (histidine-containing phosphotransfer) domain-containing protein